MKRPWLCRIGWHKQVPSVPDPVHGPRYWRTECPRCGALWAFTLGPFLVARRWFGTRIARPGDRS
ncbi:hypothetical protein AB0M54_24400 [Actinoplanes sp. NPDC051470]|uniref:hypothetical protein n=1 Tax=Actinoplanes sp. NPDC051470 TaxID=3157224 RepID=UPI00343A3236